MKNGRHIVLSYLSTRGYLVPTVWFGASLVAQRIKHLPAMRETRIRSLGWEDPLEKEMATHSSILAWGIPWTEEPGGLQSTGSQRVGQLQPTCLPWAFIYCYENLYCNVMDEHFLLKISNFVLSYLRLYIIWNLCLCLVWGRALTLPFLSKDSSDLTPFLY